MKKVILSTLVAAGLISVSVLAATPESRRDLIHQIKDLSYYFIDDADYRSASDEELVAVQKLLSDARDLLEGRSNGPQIDYRCVSKYNDGGAPYAVAIRNEDYSYNVLKPLIYSSKDLCESSLTASHQFGSVKLLCSSKYSDGNNPHSIYMINEFDQSVGKASAFANVDSCQESLDKGVYSRDRFATCVPKYDDGNNPWVVMSIDSAGKATRSQIVFKTKDECQSEL